MLMASSAPTVLELPLLSVIIGRGLSQHIILIAVVVWNGFGVMLLIVMASLERRSPFWLMSWLGKSTLRHPEGYFDGLFIISGARRCALVLDSAWKRLGPLAVDVLHEGMVGLSAEQGREALLDAFPSDEL